MKSVPVWRLLAGGLAVFGLFVLWQVQALPPVVATHFGVDGLANGDQSRSLFAGLFLLAGGGGAALAAWLPGRQARRGEVTDLPHAAYWLAPERRDGTIAWLDLHALCLALWMLLFMAGNLWLIGRPTPCSRRRCPVAPPCCWSRFSWRVSCRGSLRCAAASVCPAEGWRAAAFSGSIRAVFRS